MEYKVSVKQVANRKTHKLTYYSLVAGVYRRISESAFRHTFANAIKIADSVTTIDAAFIRYTFTLTFTR